MFIVNLKKNGVVNADCCLAFKRTGSKILAIMEQHDPECPYVISLAEYSTAAVAEKEFENLLKAIKGKAHYYAMREEDIINDNASLLRDSYEGFAESRKE